MKWLLLLSILACGPGTTPEVTDLSRMAPVQVSPQKRVIPIYLVAPDTPDAEAGPRLAAFGQAMAVVQRWYSSAMPNGATFAYDPPRVLASAFTREQWADFGAAGFLKADGSRTDGCGLWYAAQADLPDLLKAAGLPRLFGGDAVYVVIAGGATGGGCGGGGLATVEEMELDRYTGRCPTGTIGGARTCEAPGGLAGIDPWCSQWPHDLAGYGCTCLGALAHEIGHAFGLPHGSARTGDALTQCANRTIMDRWWDFERGVTLCDPDRADLAATPFFAVP